MAGATPLRRSLTIQLRVIGALLMREIITRYGRHNVGFLWLFGEPMLFTLGVAALWAFTRGGHAGSMPIIAFAVTGYSSILLWRNMVNRSVNAVTPNSALLYHRNVKMLDILAARILLEVCGATISFVVLSLFIITFNWMPPPDDLLKVITGWLILIWVGASLAMVIGPLSELNDMVDKIWHPLSYVLLPLSGAAYMVDWLPLAAQKIVLLIPMVHGLEILRNGYFGSTVRPHYDLAYVTIVCLSLTFIGLLLERWVSRRLVIE